MNVTFSEGKKANGVIRLTCRETAAEFVITTQPFGFAIEHNGRKIAERSTLAYALALVEQQAKLELRVAMSESAFA